MITNYRAMRMIALSLACVSAPDTNAAEPKLPRDGWVSWRVPAVDDAPAWCCFNWNGREASRKTCKLDDRDEGRSLSDDDRTTDTVQVYTRTAGGKIDRLRVLSANCPVETNTPIQTLGDVSADDSARWLSVQFKQDAKPDREVGENALAALALHRGDFARDAMAGFARDPRSETRKKAVFWLAMLRGDEGAGLVSSVMFNDQVSDVREHAAFALSQSKSARAAPDLVRLGNTDKIGEVRSRAWFWLAQMGAADAEKAIGAAIRKDPDAGVREEAVFALSQLPDDRATRALIAVAEDQALSREQRKKAVFWLSQSESDAAQGYLEKVLARAAR